MPLELFDFQRVGINFLRTQKRCLLADEMGLGKTVQAIVACRDRGVGRILVICPNSLKWNWAREFSLWAPGIPTQVVEGTLTQRVSQVGAIKSQAQVGIVNFEVFRYRRGSREWPEDIQALLKIPWDTVIVDEAHRVKNRSIQTTKGVKAVTKGAPNVYLLTGTPILNRAEEVWSLLNILDPKIFSSYWKFVYRFCIVTYNGFGNEIGGLNPLRVPELRRVLRQYSLRRLKSEVLPSLPGKLPVKKIWVQLDPEQRKIYNEMAIQMFTTLEGGEEVSVAIVLAQITRLKQIAIDPNLMTKKEAPLAGAKVDAIMSLIESSGSEKLVIFSQFSRVLDRLELVLEDKGIPSVKITGEVTGEDREGAVNQFQADPTCKIFLCGIKSGGVGITLTAAHTAIFLDKFWSPAINWQAQERLDRIGQTEKVTIIELLALDTIEEGIETMLSSKVSEFASLFNITVTPEVSLNRESGKALLEILRYGVTPLLPHGHS